jgi:uncharacterized membrane protein YebE (DUF533 family)
MKDLASAGTQAGSFLGNFLNPVIGGTTTTTVTEKPSSSSMTTSAIVIIAVVIVLGVVGYLVYKNKR